MANKRKQPSHRLTVIGFAAFVIFTSAACAHAGDPAAGREKASTCAACHGIDGIAKIPNAPNIAGDSAIYLTSALNAYRSGKREDAQMSIVAKRLNDQEIADLAAWYSAIKVTADVPEL
jgi:cytochrome c553